MIYNIRPKGITSSLPSICKNVCSKGDIFLDLLYDGTWKVSRQDTAIGHFSKAEDALYFFMYVSDLPKPLTREEEDEAIAWIVKEFKM